MVRDPDFKKIIARLSALSNRERQVTTLVCDGLSNKMIAQKLGVREGTVKIHLHNIYKKLGISSRNALAASLALSCFKTYRRKQIAELRPYVPGENLVGISVSEADKLAGSPKLGDMIARNPKNHKDQWLVAARYFTDNFDLA
jgi:DNA-binding CsgD family transcriptional regulator